MRDAAYRRILQQQRLTRRDCLRLGGAGGLSLGMLPLLWAAKEPRDGQRKANAPGFGRAKSIILIYASGGQSQLDMWDMKPQAPEEVRGVFKPSATSVPGTTICEHLPQLANAAHLFTLVRSSVARRPRSRLGDVSGSDRPAASEEIVQSARRGRPTIRLMAPCSSAYVRPSVCRSRPCTSTGRRWCRNTSAPGQNAGFLGRACEPLLLGDPTEEPLAFRPRSAARSDRGAPGRTAHPAEGT